MASTDALKTNLEEVHQRIRRACQRAGRSASSVTLIGVTKQVPVEVMREAVALGLTDLGENRVQEARVKQAELGYKLQATSYKLQAGACSLQPGLQPAACSLQPVRWHLIGHLQRNKVKLAVELFDVIHSVDSLELARELERHAKQATGDKLQAAGRDCHALEVLIQVNVSGETAKFGCRPDETVALAKAIDDMSHVSLGGLMTIAPFSDDPETVRPIFRRLRELRDAVACSLQPATESRNAGRRSPGRSRGTACSLKLSMGMSHDFEVAIEEGADLVRIGTAIFGARDR